MTAIYAVVLLTALAAALLDGYLTRRAIRRMLAALEFPGGRYIMRGQGLPDGQGRP